MINIEFVIKEFPEDLSKSYALDAFTEGVLTIQVNGELAFKEDGILLVELSEKLQSWIAQVGSDKNCVNNFYYSSMDFEEEPILAFNYDTSENLYRIESVWGINKPTVLKDDLVNACKIFINELNSVVQDKIKSQIKK